MSTLIIHPSREMAEKVLLLMGKCQFTLQFTKRTNGETRFMRAQLDGKQLPKGSGLRFDPSSRDLTVVLVLDRDAYRMVNLREC